MTELGMLSRWQMAAELLQVGLPVTFVAYAVGARSDSKKLLALRDEIATERQGGCCPTSLERQMWGHRRRLEASLFLRIYRICGGVETFGSVQPPAFVKALRWYLYIRHKHCLDGVKMIDARVGWLLAQGLSSSRITEVHCSACGAIHYHFVESIRAVKCPVCAIEEDWRMRRVVPPVGWLSTGMAGAGQADCLGA